MSTERNLIDGILHSSYINGIVETWMKNVRSEEDRKLKASDVYTKEMKEPTLIKPSALLRLLNNLVCEDSYA